MEKARKRKYSIQAGLIMSLVWLLAASFVLSVSAATTTSSTGENGFDWSYEVDNTEAGASGNFSGSLSGTTVVFSISANSSTFAEGSCGGENTNAASTTVTATVTNNTGNTIKVESITSNTATVQGLAVNGMLENGKSFTIKITANPTNTSDTTSRQASDTVTITYSVVENIEIVFLGAANVTYAYEGTTISGTDASVKVTQAPGTTITLPDATVSSGTFIGWRMSDGSLQQSGTTVTVNSDSTVYPVVLSGNETYPYTVNGTTYCFWEDAAYAAGTNGTIILNQDYTLPTTLAANGVSPAGGKFVTGTDGAVSYIIPSGVTLLIPYDDANTLCTTAPACAENTYITPSVYRTLTMANGANITVNGAISLSAKQSSKIRYNAMPSGPLPFIKMDSGSNITVKKGGALYAWGYITGSGSVSVESGGTVYECFQIGDYRGGDVTSTMTYNADTYGVFPFTQYYLQNIEVPMTLYAGAIEKGYTSVQVTGVGDQHSDIPFIGTLDSMFVIDSGYVVKDYVEGTGRTNIEIHGDISVSTISMSIRVSIFVTVNIDSSNYSLPIPNHFTVSVESGKINLAQSMVFLPGSELTIKQGASCTLGSGKTIYVYDLDEWYQKDSTTKGYTGYNEVYSKLKYVPGGDGTTGRLKDAQIQIDGTVDASAGSVYVTASGANIFSTGTGVVKVASTTDSVAHQVITDNTDISSWPKIAMQPAILQDADDTDVATKEKAGTYTYYASTRKWCPPGHRYESVVTDPTCTTAGYTTHTCIACGSSYTDSETAALGHNYESVVTEPTCTDIGYTTYTCTVCGDSYISDIKAPTGHAWDENGKCSCGAVEANLITIAGANIKAGDSLDMYFYVSTEKVESSDYAVVTKTFADGRPNVTETIPFSEWKAYNSSLTRFGFSDISAKEMTDKIYVTIYDSNNIAKSYTWIDSVHDYAVRAIKAYSSNETLLAALVDMLNYGAAAQTYFEYNDEAKNLANVDIGDYQVFAAKEVKPNDYLVKGDNYYRSTVTASNELILTFYFENISTDMTATVEYTDHNGGDPVQITIPGEKFVERGSLYGVQVTGLSIADGYQLVTCKVKDGETTVASATDSVESFIARSTDGNGDVFEMLMKFIYSAHTYFHS